MNDGKEAFNSNKWTKAEATNNNTLSISMKIRGKRAFYHAFKNKYENQSIEDKVPIFKNRGKAFRFYIHY